MVVVLGEDNMPEDGFSIGSQAAAAGANVLAGVKEGVYVSTRTMKVQYELMKYRLLMRWADDNIQVWDRRTSKPTKKALARLRASNFYGGRLEFSCDL